MKVVCLSDSTSWGGAEVQMLDMFRGIQSAGHRVLLLTAGDRFERAACASGLQAERLRWSLGWPPRIAEAAVRLRGLWRAGGVDVLHAVGLRAAVAAALARAGLRPAPGLIVTVHNVTNARPWSYGIAAAILRVTGGFLTTVSDSERAKYLKHGFPPERCRTIYNGVPLGPSPTAERRRTARGALGLPRNGLVLAHIGRLSVKKGHAILLSAMAALPPQALPVHLLVAGEGPLRAALEATARQLGLADRVHFLGFQQDVGAVLQAADLLVLPSFTEAFPMVLLEAMAAGLPVIASRVGGVAELVGHGRDGWLVEPGNVMALRAALLEALLDPGARATRGRAARERVAAEFSHERMVSRTLGVYRDVLEA